MQLNCKSALHVQLFRCRYCVELHAKNHNNRIGIGGNVHIFPWKIYRPPNAISWGWMVWEYFMTLIFFTTQPVRKMKDCICVNSSIWVVFEQGVKAYLWTRFGQWKIAFILIYCFIHHHRIHFYQSNLNKNVYPVHFRGHIKATIINGIFGILVRVPYPTCLRRLWEFIKCTDKNCNQRLNEKIPFLELMNVGMKEQQHRVSQL